MSQTESDGELEPMRTLLPSLPSWVGPSKRPAYLEVFKGGKLINIFSLDTAPIVSLGRSAEKVSFALNVPSVNYETAMLQQ